MIGEAWVSFENVRFWDTMVRLMKISVSREAQLGVLSRKININLFPSDKPYIHEEGEQTDKQNP